jgi:DNA-binding winged helix-turn-helix (wHTH) protein
MAWTFGAFELDPERFQLTRDGEQVRLEPQVLSLLIYLVRNRDCMVTKDEVAAAVWQGEAVSDASLSSRIRSARKAVGDDGVRQAVIRTVHGRGYRFTCDVATLPARNGASTNSVQEPVAPAAGRPSIAILPFQPLAIAPELAILGEAIPHEIIQALSRLRWLAVIARGSTFRFRQPANIQDCQVCRARIQGAALDVG